MVRVTSSVTHSVTCGAVNADDTIAWAVILRTPLTGIRVSSAPGARAGTTAAGAAAAPLATASTSARVTTPPGPLGSIVLMSTPRSLASLRTGGLASARIGCGEPLAAGTTGAASSASSAGTSGACTAPAENAAFTSCRTAADDTPPPAPLRGRRFASVVRGP